MIRRPSMGARAGLFLLGLSFLFLSGCGGGGGGRTVYPVTSGSHATHDPTPSSSLKHNIVVWSNHPGVGTRLVAWFQEMGQAVVERALLQEVLNEQRIQLTHSPENDANILRVGKLIGADRVVFAVVTTSFSSGSDYRLSVAVRGTNVETGEIRWSGIAQYPGAVNNPEQGLIYLTEAAMRRAMCPVELGLGYRYENKMGKYGEVGCLKDGKSVKLSERRGLIQAIL